MRTSSLLGSISGLALSIAAIVYIEQRPPATPTTPVSPHRVAIQTLATVQPRLTIIVHTREQNGIVLSGRIGDTYSQCSVFSGICQLDFPIAQPPTGDVLVWEMGTDPDVTGTRMPWATFETK